MPGKYKVLKEYTHTQSTPSLTWTINHNCDGIPVVDVFVEHNGETQKILPAQVSYTDSNNLTITFTTARSGVAKILG